MTCPVAITVLPGTADAAAKASKLLGRKFNET